jgi:predicted small secreted protein
MQKFVIAVIVLIPFLLFGCNTNAGTKALNIQETAAEISEVTNETIHMNNCGGKADSEQIAEKSKDVSIEGGGLIGIDGKVMKGEVSAKYATVTGLSKSIKLIAPPGTNMEFLIAWTEKTWVGIVTTQGSDGHGNYKVSVPVSVELISSRDLGNCPVPTPTITNTPAPAPTETNIPAPTNTKEAVVVISETPQPENITYNTDPNSILSVGETWTTNGLSVQFQKAEFLFGDEMDLHFVFMNNTGKTLFFNFNENVNVTLRDDKNHVYTWDSIYQKDVILNDGETFSEEVFKGGKFSNAKYLIIEVNIPEIITAKWRYN